MKNPKTRALIHIFAGITLPVTFFAILPDPWNLLVGAALAGISAFAGFLDQSISKDNETV